MRSPGTRPTGQPLTRPSSQAAARAEPRPSSSGSAPSCHPPPCKQCRVERTAWQVRAVELTTSANCVVLLQAAQCAAQRWHATTAATGTHARPRPCPRPIASSLVAHAGVRLLRRGVDCHVGVVHGELLLQDLALLALRRRLHVLGLPQGGFRRQAQAVREIRQRCRARHIQAGKPARMRGGHLHQTHMSRARQRAVPQPAAPPATGLTLMFTPSTTTSPRLVMTSSTVPTLPLSPPAITCGPQNSGGG